MSASTSMRRRQLLKALGLGALASVLPRGRIARADEVAFPSRIVFFVTPHGHIPKGWNIDIPGASANAYAERSLVEMSEANFSEGLRPFYAYRDRMLAIEGLSHTSVLADIAEIGRTTGDANNHSVSVAGLLTGSRALQRSGSPCSGGIRSIDQEIAARTSAPGRFGSRVYGFDYVPNQTVAPFSFLGAGQATPSVADPQTAFADLMGFVKPSTTGPLSREQTIATLRPSVLDTAAREYELLAPQLGAEGKRKLDAHRALVRDLELGLGTGLTAKCDPSFDANGHQVVQFMRLIKLAFSCDLTRVATFVCPVPETTELGYPADATMHGTYAHGSIENATACGAPYTLTAERAMIDLDKWHAAHLMELLNGLDSILEGSGTVLDHTVVVWLTELGTPTHQHHDAPVVMIGGCNGAFQTGRYVRYPRNLPNPMKGFPLTGPAHNRLHVSLLKAMGQPDTRFGMANATAADGTTLSFQGPLRELHKAV